MPTRKEIPVAGRTRLTQLEAIEALGALVRAGFDPEASAAALGLPEIPHSGALPVTVQPPSGSSSPTLAGKAPKTRTAPAGTRPRFSAAPIVLSKPATVLVDQLRGALGLPVSASAQVVVDAASAALPGRAGKAKKVAASGGRAPRPTKKARRNVAAQLAPGTPAPPPGSSARDLLDWAEGTGRIAGSSRPVWAESLKARPAETDATLRRLEPIMAATQPRPRPAPVARLGASLTTGAPSASGLDVSDLAPATRAVVAREGDAGRAWSLIENYAGVGDEMVAAVAQMVGDHQFANAVRAEMGRTYAEAEAARSEQFRRSSEAHAARMAADHDAHRRAAESQQAADSGLGQ